MPYDKKSKKTRQNTHCINCGKELRGLRVDQISLAVPIENEITGDSKRIQNRVKRMESFLLLISDNGSIGNALKELKMSYETYVKWKEDPTFQLKLKDANEKFKGRLEKELIRRAVEGVEEPVVSAGKLVAFKRNYSDSLLQVALKANNPEKYNSDSKKVGAEVGVKEDGTKYMKVYSGFDPDEV